MTITKNVADNTVTLAVEGRVDTTTAPELDREIKLLEEDNLVLDFEKLEYISSAGLRVLLAAQKSYKAREGKMIVKNVNEDVNEVFEITGFTDILTIE